MQKEIADWREEGRHADQPDLPLVLLGVDGVITDLSARRSEQDPDVEQPVPLIPEYMSGLVGHIVDIAEVWWCSTDDQDSLDDLCGVLGIRTLPVVALASDEMSDASVRRLLWNADAGGRATYFIDDFSGVVPARLPDGTVVIDTAVDMVLRPERVPSELRPG
ncbi:hypothetical protein BMS3Abin02_00466 [bacterium BMS3Abin02]|nr:hypothetical protein BMS3Abin02_00466 [bacterium BMS3Abin02]GBE21864.1 hypothetical protein BMS3Bbin01_01216 [bacterium BMS3Bbin01]HDH25595.1 hypothetical protein [Actinomycetota bacterium]HDK46147.1 hypothetical protein [Actinomycetota bacterium]HDL48945.1 hypothetical protein [Actinomycetota bacterium]